MGAPQAVTVFNTQTGAVLQTFKPLQYTAAPPASPIRRMASTCCSARTAATLPYVNVNSSTGLLTSNVARISVPLDATVNLPAFGASEPVLNSVNCTRPSLAGNQRSNLRPYRTTGSYAIPCGCSRISRYHFLSDGHRDLAGYSRPPTSCWTTTIRWPRST